MLVLKRFVLVLWSYLQTRLAADCGETMRETYIS